MDLFTEMAKSLACAMEASDEDQLFELLSGEGYDPSEIEQFISIANK